MFELPFFRIFELIIIIAFLYVAYRFLRADFTALKKKIDKTLTEEEQNGSPNSTSTQS